VRTGAEGQKGTNSDAVRDTISALVDGSRRRLGSARIYRFCISLETEPLSPIKRYVLQRVRAATQSDANREFKSRQRFSRQVTEAFRHMSDCGLPARTCRLGRTHRVGREVRHGLSKFLTQGATRRLLRLLMMTKQMRLNAFAMNCVAHRPDRAIDRQTKIFCRSPRFQARTLRLRVNYKFPFP
jgi:hypothetical protein